MSSGNFFHILHKFYWEWFILCAQKLITCERLCIHYGIGFILISMVSLRHAFNKCLVNPSLLNPFYSIKNVLIIVTLS